ncbi:hypothetical protein [Flavobacterium pedocola]
MKKYLLTAVTIGIISFALLTFFGYRYEQSFIEFDSTKPIKTTLSKQFYTVYSVSDNPKHKVAVSKAKDNALMFRLYTDADSFARLRVNMTINEKKYYSVGHVAINEEGQYHLTIQNSPEEQPIKLALQGQNDDTFYLKALLITYVVCLISAAATIIAALLLILKKIRSKSASEK